MSELVHDFIFSAAERMPHAEALVYRGERLDYAALAQRVRAAAGAVQDAGVQGGERVAVFLEKRIEGVVALFGAAAAGAVFVPVNPLLKPEQVAYILADCGVRVLVTSPERLRQLAPALTGCPKLRTILLAGATDGLEALPGVVLRTLGSDSAPARPVERIDLDVAAILYTSGSTGKPKGVVLSHRNLVAGALSVSSYLALRPDDRLLAVLPLSFDYGLSQLTCAFHVGAAVVLINHLFAQDIGRAVVAERITGLAAVPPLWIELARLDWSAATTLRYLTNSGGAMPRAAVDALRAAIPQAELFLMYGLTEAFRSTYLPPSELDRRPDSIGRAIPNAEVMVVRPDGTPCATDEPGELVHRGALVALGYWNDPVKTAERFRPTPGRDPALPLAEMAVWSGDTVRRDAEGYLYFIGRSDEMIKVSGYRVSPTEVEEAFHASGLATEVAAFGVPHPKLGQAVVAVARLREDAGPDAAAGLQQACRRLLPAYMVPAHIDLRARPLPRNPNGKIDRPLLRADFMNLFEDQHE
ncbi:acyl-CoA ligase (AMP-forming), exosortase A system-associated [Massilia varians]|uniref:Acyl-CoA ligase (AMP-forming), exosortase A system-associated n=1 Tax=Massilia varians TaxID=457921 RepID=A0ABN6T3Z2_9BURK|nr:acyl-CoA ligase (AMP-forming), exosortase A system-associated [Massilia varians]BDT56877.1 acyl-CoA ligase (AMP-forming), exosortase A system-associated [Massilia varians]